MLFFDNTRTFRTSVRRTTGSRIGPEPTTDRFVAVMHGPDERIVRFPGHSFRIRLSYDADVKDSMSTHIVL